MSTFPIEAISALVSVEAQALPGAVARSPAPSGRFEQLLLDGVANVDGKLRAADALADAFKVDDSMPPHRVMFAQDEARLSFELLMAIRSRLVEGYQDIMRMQL